MPTPDSNTNYVPDPRTAALMRGTLKILTAGGIVAALIYVFGVDWLIAFALYILVPTLACLALFKLVKEGTLDFVINGEMASRMKQQYEAIKANAEALAAQQTAAA